MCTPPLAAEETSPCWERGPLASDLRSPPFVDPLPRENRRTVLLELPWPGVWQREACELPPLCPWVPQPLCPECWGRILVLAPLPVIREETVQGEPLVRGPRCPPSRPPSCGHERSRRAAGAWGFGVPSGRGLLVISGEWALGNTGPPWRGRSRSRCPWGPQRLPCQWARATPVSSPRLGEDGVIR